MLLERLDGRIVEKAIMRKEFADVHYLRAMLLSVFTALGKAQAWLGGACLPADNRLQRLMRTCTEEVLAACSVPSSLVDVVLQELMSCCQRPAPCLQGSTTQTCVWPMSWRSTPPSPARRRPKRS